MEQRYMEPIQLDTGTSYPEIQYVNIQQSLLHACSLWAVQVALSILDHGMFIYRQKRAPNIEETVSFAMQGVSNHIIPQGVNR